MHPLSSMYYPKYAIHVIFVVYLAATQERDTVKEFVATLEHHTMSIRDAMLTAAEEWKFEGIVEGIEGSELHFHLCAIDPPVKSTFALHQAIFDQVASQRGLVGMVLF